MVGIRAILSLLSIELLQWLQIYVNYLYQWTVLLLYVCTTLFHVIYLNYNYFHSQFSQLVYRLGQLIKSSALAKLCLGLFPPLQCPRSFLPFFMLFLYYYFVCFFLLLHPCFSHARSIPCGINTSSMGSLFSIVHAKWSVVFWSFGTTILSPLYNNNNERCLYITLCCIKFFLCSYLLCIITYNF